jgi:hypothetical protein
MKTALLYPWFQLPHDLAMASGASDKALIEIINQVNRLKTTDMSKEIQATWKVGRQSEISEPEADEKYEQKNLELRKLLNTGLATDLMSDILKAQVPVWFMDGGRMRIQKSNRRLLIGSLCPFITESAGNAWLAKKSYNLTWLPNGQESSPQERQDKHLYDECIRAGMSPLKNAHSPLKGIVKYANKLKVPRKTLSDAIKRHIERQSKVL